jgi:hypothetical protein
MSLMTYRDAERIQKLLDKKEKVYVQIIHGSKTGTVAKVNWIKRINFSNHTYCVTVDKNRPFWISGGVIEELPNYHGDTCIFRDVAAEPKKDFLGREIKVNTALVYFRSGSESTKSCMILGTVRYINPITGAVYVRPMKIGDETISIDDAKIIRLAKPESAMIVDATMLDQVLLLKLTC